MLVMLPNTSFLDLFIFSPVLPFQAAIQKHTTGALNGYHCDEVH